MLNLNFLLVLALGLVFQLGSSLPIEEMSHATISTADAISIAMASPKGSLINPFFFFYLTTIYFSPYMIYLILGANKANVWPIYNYNLVQTDVQSGFAGAIGHSSATSNDHSVPSVAIQHAMASSRNPGIINSSALANSTAIATVIG